MIVVPVKATIPGHSTSLLAACAKGFVNRQGRCQSRLYPSSQILPGKEGIISGPQPRQFKGFTLNRNPQFVASQDIDIEILISVSGKDLRFLGRNPIWAVRSAGIGHGAVRFHIAVGIHRQGELVRYPRVIPLLLVSVDQLLARVIAEAGVIIFRGGLQAT